MKKGTPRNRKQSEEREESYMVGASASEGVAATAACFSEAMKCDAKTTILSPVLLLLFIHKKVIILIDKPQ